MCTVHDENLYGRTASSVTKFDYELNVFGRNGPNSQFRCLPEPPAANLDENQIIKVGHIHQIIVGDVDDPVLIDH